MSNILKISVDGVKLEQSCELSLTLEGFLERHGVAHSEFLVTPAGNAIAPKWELAHRWNETFLCSISHAEISPEIPTLEASDLSVSLGV